MTDMLLDLLSSTFSGSHIQWH